jgi:hypothetical protein
MGEKKCIHCGVVKPLSAFYKAPGMRDGRRGDCIDCNKATKRLRHVLNREAYIAKARQWQRDNPERHAAWAAEYRNRPERKRAMRDLYYRRTYGLSADEVDAMLEAQGGGCAICGVLPDTLGRLHLDHDHVSGEIRGLLCQSCNQAIGHLRDDPGLLRRAADYLETSPGAPGRPAVQP